MGGVLRVVQVVQRKVGRDDQRLAAAVTAVNHIEHLFQPVFRPAFHAEVVKDQQRITTKAGNVLVAPLKAGGKVIEDKSKVRHADGDFFLHEGVCDTACKVAFAGAYAAPEQAADIVCPHIFPMLHIPAGKPGLRVSGALGRNLIDIEFSTRQVADSDEHRLLQTLRQTELQDANARESLYRRIIDAIDMGESSYLILLAADTYDVPHRSRDDLEVPDASETVFRYFVCAICPVKDPTLALQYSDRDKEFRGSSTGHIAQPPALGFLFPAFDDRAANIYNALFYSKDTAQLHQEVIDAVFCVQEAPMSPQEQQNLFAAALTETLEKDCIWRNPLQQNGKSALHWSLRRPD